MRKSYLLVLSLSFVFAGAASANLPENFKPKYLSRSDWEARAANHTELSMDQKAKVQFIIGHTVSSNPPGEEFEKRLAKSIQRVHMDTNKWADVGYHFMVGPMGTVIEGRNLAATPACYYGHNSGSVCGAFWGCFDDAGCNPPDAVTDEMIFAMGHAIAAKAFELKIVDLGRHNIKGFSELGTKYPYAPGNRIMQNDASGVAPIDVIVEVAKQELAKMSSEKNEL
jgi:hypothetical protein